MGLVKDFVKLSRDEFPKLFVTEPKGEAGLHALIYFLIRLKGYDANYTGGRAQPDFIVATKRSRREDQFEVKVTSTAKIVEDEFKHFSDCMKGTKWKIRILYVWNHSKKVAYSKVKEIGKQTKYGRTIITIPIRR